MPSPLRHCLVIFLLAAASRGGSEPVASRIPQIRHALLDSTSSATIIVAHRGYHRDFPENSIPAITAAFEIGRIVELDIRKSADGELVLMHDATTNRTTSGSGKVSDQPLAELRAVQLEHAGRPTGLRVPTLAEAFDAARGKIMINPVLKAVTLEEVVAAARKADMLDHCVFKAPWSDMTSKRIAWLKANPDVLFMPLVQSAAEADAAIDQLGCPALELIFPKNGWRYDEADAMRNLRARGVPPWVNSLGDGPRGSGLGDRQFALGDGVVFRRLADLGFSIIQTDLPEAVVGQADSR